MPNDFGLTTEVLKQLNDIFSQFETIDEALIYGSRAKGTYKKGSDIDITLKGVDLNLHLLNQLSIKLDELMLPYQFDISIFFQINNQDLIKHIERVGKTIYQKTP